jgi:carbon-monoxide dehydrogenase iron sulfur subunit
MKRLLVDSAECSGCRYCEMVCSFHHEGRFSPSLSRVTVIKEDKYGMDYPVFCRQCEDCPPIATCPTEALSKNWQGFIAVDTDACTGCGTCVEACKYGAVKLDGRSNPLICDLCGGSPVCVERCPTGALRFEESEEPSELPEEVFRELRGRWGIAG